jgi:hypothetical protein
VEPLHDRVEVPDPVTLFGVKVQVSPVDGFTTAVRLTTPLKLCRAVTVMVEVPETPARTMVEIGLAEIAKSCTLSATVAE